MSACRHCGKPLPFLQKFSGEDEFCSRSHRQSYQDEFNRLALGRLADAFPVVNTPVPVRETVPHEAARVTEPTVIAVPAQPSRSEADLIPQPAGRRPISWPDLCAPGDPVLPVAKYSLPAIWQGRIESALRPELLDLGWGEIETAESRPEARTVRVLTEDPPVPPRCSAATLSSSTPLSSGLAGFRNLTGAVAKPELNPAGLQNEPIRSLPKGIFVPRYDALPLRYRICFAPQPTEIKKPEPKQREIAEDTAPPEFAIAGGNVGFLGRIPMAIKVIGLIGLLGGGGVPLWKQFNQSASAKSASRPSNQTLEHAVAMGPGGWFTRDATDSEGKARNRTFSLYKPSLDLTDYRMEFIGKIERGGLGWVVRLQDQDNYYSMRLRRVEGKMSLARWAVVDGDAQSLTEIALPPVGGADSGYKVRVDVRGPRITTAVQGQHVDLWTDNRLASGGFGFTNDIEERASVSSVQFFLLGK